MATVELCCTRPDQPVCGRCGTSQSPSVGCPAHDMTMVVTASSFVGEGQGFFSCTIHKPGDRPHRRRPGTIDPAQKTYIEKSAGSPEGEMRPHRPS